MNAAQGMESHSETKEILDTMVDEYLENMLFTRK